LAYGDLAYGDLAYGDLAYGDLAYGDLAYGDLAYGDLAYGDLAYGQVNGGGVGGAFATQKPTKTTWAPPKSVGVWGLGRAEPRPRPPSSPNVSKIGNSCPPHT